MFSDEQREVLHAFVRVGTLARAAEELRMTPLAVCRRLAELEATLGYAVLQPYGRHIRLTRAAARLAHESPKSE
ncbi:MULTISPECIES: LysR family transcriptional regulator [unclassified Streptomyces]|uniref:helix-turn-helix domain-containing protein n=1 Tax=unclassified Streptomyces TaxID=2593676 RepID=UPI0033A793ED